MTNWSIFRTLSTALRWLNKNVLSSILSGHKALFYLLLWMASCFLFIYKFFYFSLCLIYSIFIVKLLCFSYTASRTRCICHLLTYGNIAWRALFGTGSISQPMLFCLRVSFGGSPATVRTHLYLYTRRNHKYIALECASLEAYEAVAIFIIMPLTIMYNRLYFHNKNTCKECMQHQNMSRTRMNDLCCTV